MFKYEQEIQRANKEYQRYCKEFSENGTLSSDDEDTARMFAYYGSLSSNTRIAIDKYYNFVEGEGYIRVKESNSFSIENLFPAASLPVKEFDFANGEADCPGLYFLGMIGRNPNGEDFYLVKIGCAKNIKERVNQYRSYNPMIYHNNIIYCPDADLREAEKQAHRALADFAIARAAHAMEWFYVDKETYFALCENPWQYIFEEEA
jgi:hypothetical protein